MTASAKTCRICLKTPMSEHPMGEKNGYRLVACHDCGSIGAEPWPTTEALSQFYGEIQPEVVHIPNPQKEIASIKNLLAKHMPNAAGKRFLDVSSRQGYGVVAAKDMGFKAHGIDSHEFFIAFAKDKYDPALFELSTVQDYATRGLQADFIYVAEAFCEQPDPDGYAAALAKILAPGGKIYLHEPDGNHLRLPMSFTNWRFVYPPMNFSYLSGKGMRALLARHGLKVEKKYLTWAPFLRMVVSHA